jgi:hypothetical protein
VSDIEQIHSDLWGSIFGSGTSRFLPMSKASIMIRCAQVFVAWLALASVAAAANPGLEYRFKALDGVEFKWRDGKVEKLERQPFMVATDFGNAMAIKSTNPNARDSFEIDIVHNKPGKQKYRANAKIDHTREYCVVFKEIVLQCYAVAPKIAALYEQGGTIYGPFSKTEAEDLTRQINRSLR